MVTVEAVRTQDLARVHFITVHTHISGGLNAISGEYCVCYDLLWNPPVWLAYHMCCTYYKYCHTMYILTRDNFHKPMLAPTLYVIAKGPFLQAYTTVQVIPNTGWERIHVWTCSWASNNNNIHRFDSEVKTESCYLLVTYMYTLYGQTLKLFTAASCLKSHMTDHHRKQTTCLHADSISRTRIALGETDYQKPSI